MVKTHHYHKNRFSRRVRLKAGHRSDRRAIRRLEKKKS